MRGKRMALAMMLAGIGFAAAAEPVQAQTAPAATLSIDKARIDAALGAMIADGRAAGVSALIWQDGLWRRLQRAGGRLIVIGVSST